jgi:CHAT domain-containing protein/tetratricopeptide (TPR) repeat protein
MRVNSILAPLILCLAGCGLACGHLPPPRSRAADTLEAPPTPRPLPPAPAAKLADQRELRLTLPAGTYVRLAILSTSPDMVVRQLGPDGKTEELQLAGGGIEPVRLSAVAASAGDYQWTVGPRDRQAPPGAHAIALEEQRPSGPCDEARRRAERAVLAARRELSRPGRWTISTRALLGPAAGDAAAVGEREGILAVQIETARAVPRQEAGIGIALSQRSLGLARDLDDRAAQAAALQAMAKLLTDDRELEALRAALELRRQIGDESGEADVLEQQADNHVNHGEVAQAVQGYLEALGLEWRNDHGQTYSLVRVGRLYEMQGDLDRARSYLDAGLATGQAAGDLEAQAYGLRESARVDVDLGELQAAYDDCARAYKLLAPLGISETSAWAVAALAASLLHLGEPEKARQRYGEALSDFEALEHPSGRINALLGMGSSYEAEGRPAKALESFQKALDLIHASGVGSMEGMARYDLGTAYGKLDQPLQAAAELEKALVLEAAGPVRRAQILVELAHAYGQAGDLAAADSALHRALQLSGRAPAVEAAALAGIAGLERDRGDLGASRSAIERALAITERLRAGVIRPDQRVSFLASRRSYYELYVDLLMRLHRRDPGAGHDAEALAASEQARARGLLDLLAKERVDLRRGIPDDLRQRETEVGERIARLQKRLWSTSLALSDAEVGGLRRDLAQAEEDEQELEGEMRRRQPAYAAVREPHPLPLPEIQRLLDGRTALLEFFVGKAGSYLFAVTRGGLAVHPLPPGGQLVALVERVRAAVDHASRLRAGLHAADAYELYRLLLLPAAAELRDKPRLILAPDGPLYSLSFEVLLTGPVEGNAAVRRDLPYLLRDHSVSYIPSASVLAQLPTQSRPSSWATDEGKLFVGVGDPEAIPSRSLPAARDEIRRIASSFPAERTVTFLGPEASEENVKRSAAVKSARYLHFATHGVLDESTPELSGLRLAHAGDTAEDGLLQVRDVFNLQLHADLVVLSACQTGMGKEVSGEGLIGMTRAFLYAGAASVLVSLWRVDDESTADLMVSFYRHLERSGDKSEALRLAKLDLIDRSPYFQPYYWAPFILVGEAQGSGAAGVTPGAGVTPLVDVGPTRTVFPFFHEGGREPWAT